MWAHYILCIYKCIPYTLGLGCLVSQETCVFVDSFWTVVNNSSIFKFRRVRNIFQSDFWIYNIIIIISKVHLLYYYIFLLHILIWFWDSRKGESKRCRRCSVCVLCVCSVCVYTYIFEISHPKKTIVFPSTLHPNILH